MDLHSCSLNVQTGIDYSSLSEIIVYRAFQASFGEPLLSLILPPQSIAAYFNIDICLALSPFRTTQTSDISEDLEHLSLESATTSHVGLEVMRSNHPSASCAINVPLCHT